MKYLRPKIMQYVPLIPRQLLTQRHSNTRRFHKFIFNAITHMAGALTLDLFVKTALGKSGAKKITHH